jgi:DNA-directed RNA polymerase specialized sigma24 family protein
MAIGLTGRSTVETLPGVQPRSRAALLAGFLIPPSCTYRGAFGLVYSMLGERQDAEDAVQEAAAKPWQSIAILREDTSPQSWFFAIVANQCRDARRGSRRLLCSLSDVPELSMGDHADKVRVTWNSNVPWPVYRRKGAVSSSSATRWTCPPSQIAQVLRWRVGTVKSRLHRTLRKFEAGLAPYPYDILDSAPEESVACPSSCSSTGASATTRSKSASVCWPPRSRWVTRLIPR